MEIQSTSHIKFRPNILTYGPSKSGKTHLLGTLQTRRVIVADTDGGLASLRDKDIHYCPIRKWEDWQAFASGVISDAWRQTYQVVAIDDLHRLGELFLEYRLPKEKDGRQAYFKLKDEIYKVIHATRAWAESYGYYVITNSKEERELLESKSLFIQPMFPGDAIQKMLDYLYDEVYHTEMAPDANGVQQHVLRTKKTPVVMAGSRFGKLREIELADYDYIFDQMEALG